MTKLSYTIPHIYFILRGLEVSINEQFSLLTLMTESYTFNKLHIDKIGWKSEYNLSNSRDNFFQELYSNDTEPVTERLSNYIEDNTLGNGIELLILVKRLNQQERDKLTLSEIGIADNGFKNGLRGSRDSKGYHQGLALTTTLQDDYIHPDRVNHAAVLTQPTGTTVKNDSIIIAAGNKLVVLDKESLSVTDEITNEWFARLHTVEYSPIQNSLLTVSSSFDTIHEIDADKYDINWEMCAWDHGYPENVYGERFTRVGYRTVNEPTKVVIPSDYNGLGLPTNRTPVHINGATYDRNGDILATAFHQGELWKVNKSSGQIEVILNGLGHPHGISKDDMINNGYMITDTNGESIIYLDQKYNPKYKIDTSGIRAKVPGMERERWLQYTTQIDSNMYCSVDMPSRALIIMEPISARYRIVGFHKDWAVQMVTNIQH